jgi:hypothetical protein
MRDLAIASVVILILVILGLAVHLSDRIQEQDRQEVVRDIIYTGVWPTRIQSDGPSAGVEESGNR